MQNQHRLANSFLWIMSRLPVLNSMSGKLKGILPKLNWNEHAIILNVYQELVSLWHCWWFSWLVSDLDLWMMLMLMWITLFYNLMMIESVPLKPWQQFLLLEMLTHTETTICREGMHSTTPYNNIVMFCTAWCHSTQYSCQSTVVNKDSLP